MTSPELHRCTPIIPVSNVASGVRFFRDYLGFDAPYLNDAEAAGEYAYLRRGNALIRLVQAGPDMDMKNDPKRQMSCYIDVTGIDALFAAHKDKLNTLPSGHLRAPFDQPYGQREFHVIYEALLIFFGEPISRA